MSIEEQISQLIDKYEREAGRRDQPEADVRANYIDWLFYYLGWDVWKEDSQPTNRYHREGYQRDAGYVDVGLEIAGEPVLMLEAKRFGALPRSAERTYDRTPEEKQLFRYAHRGKKIPYCILTNFERLHVFNADHEVLILSFDNLTEYLDRLDELQRLSPDKVKAGSLQDWERKREIKPVDKEFLTSLQDWRLRLANTIYEHNLSNSVLQSNGSFDFGKLMAAVQRILDRLILIRYADDKEVLKQYDILHNIVSSYHNLGAYSRHDHLAKAFIELSHSMDSEHNTTLFEAGHLCEQVSIPNEVLASIITEMNNISFRKFTSDILGNTYEAYLGTKLALKNGEIKSEERRDIRKAGGIFYTPTMVVQYIVDNTLGQLLKELESQHGLQAIDKAKEIRVLDPACGSGSFLIYVYQVLANFYRRMNKAIGNEQVRLLASGVGADMFERIAQFKHLPKPLENYPHHILEKQLYGVDIDPEAAEIAAVNLTMQAFADTRREKLPKILNENIKVGNSLISGTEEELRRYFGDNWRDKKSFNWEQEFKDIMANGGFDVVIGNPPYVRVDSLPDEEKVFWKVKFESAVGKYDLYYLFLELAFRTVSKSGTFAFITPNRYCTNTTGEHLRQLILSKGERVIVTSVSRLPVFEDAANYPVITIVHKTPKAGMKKLTYFDVTNLEELHSMSPSYELYKEELKLLPRAVIPINVDAQRLKIALRLLEKASPAGRFVKIQEGLRIPTSWELKTPQGEQPMPIIKQFQFSRYSDIKEASYLSEKRRDLLLSSNAERILNCQKSKLIFAEDALRIEGTIDKSNGLCQGGVYFATLREQSYSLHYLLALFNSKLLTFIFKCLYSGIHMGGGYLRFRTQYLQELPIPLIDLADPVQKKMHDDLVALVEKMLELNKRLAPIRNAPSSEREELIREIKHTDAEIDQKVYQLYGLAEEERQIIDASVSKS